MEFHPVEMLHDFKIIMSVVSHVFEVIGCANIHVFEIIAKSKLKKSILKSQTFIERARIH